MLSRPARCRRAACAAAMLAGLGLAGMRAQTAAGNGPLYVALLHPLAGASSSTANGTATIQLSADGSSASVDVFFANLSSEEIISHLTVGGTGSAGTFVFGLGTGQITNKAWSFAPTGNFSAAGQQSALSSGNLYVEIDTDNFPSGELGGQFLLGTG
ncbi:MAG TPA: CHRD domain-containing protein, partial [Opitutaceae bacterium]|nr:CHRD domain-containing protein [Opitutaceae bacterium]